MIQENIRSYNGQTYSIPEGAALIDELDKRTQYSDEEYNSIALLGQKLKALEAAKLFIKEGEGLVFKASPGDPNVLKPGDYVVRVFNHPQDGEKLFVAKYLGGDPNDIVNAYDIKIAF